MPVGASPSTRPARGFPGKAGQLNSPLHFLLAAYGFRGARGHLASVTPSLSSVKVIPRTVLAPARSWGSTAVCTGSFARGHSSGGVVASHVPPLPSASLPFSRGPARLLGLILLGRRAENSFWFRTASKATPVTSAMSGRVDGGGGGGGDGEGEAKGGGSSAVPDTNPGSAAPREGAESGGEAKRGDFPVVTLDEDAVQKFAEIEVRWGESSRGCRRSSLLLSVHKLHRVTDAQQQWVAGKSTAPIK